MYRVNLDVIDKIICVELSGTMSLDEINSFIIDFNDVVSKFKHKQYSMLIVAQRLDPLSQNILPVFQKFVEHALNWIKKIAIVHGNRTITKMQFVRVENNARKIVNSNTPLMRYQVLTEAIDYLNRI